MKVRIQRDVVIDTEVAVSLVDIREAIAEAFEEAKSDPRAFSVGQFVKACWQSLSAMTDEQIRMIGPENRRHVSTALRDVADRFDKME